MIKECVRCYERAATGSLLCRTCPPLTSDERYALAKAASANHAAWVRMKADARAELAAQYQQIAGEYAAGRIDAHAANAWRAEAQRECERACDEADRWYRS